MLLLYNPPSSANRKPILPCSLLALGAVLEGEHDYVIADGNLMTDTYVGVERAIRAHGVDILGITVMPGPQLSDAVPLCKRIKVNFPHITIVWGGYFPSQHYKTVLKEAYVDFVVRGHGELVFKALLDSLRSGSSCLGLQGVACRDPKTGEPISNGLPAIPEPRHLPHFPYHRVDMQPYLRSTFLGSRTIGHHSSYGCPFFCNFCAVVNMVNGKWLPDDGRRVGDVVRALATEHGANAVEFYDNNFFTSERRIRAFTESIADLDVAWWGEGRIDTLLKYKDATWQAMADTGLKMIFMGAESGDDETLERMNKGGKLSAMQTLEIAEKMARYGIIPEMSFVLGNPPDPAADVESTIRFIRRVKKINPATEVILYMYTPVPLDGTLFDEAKAQGFKFPETLDGWVSAEWNNFVQRRSSVMPWVGDPATRRLHDFERVLNAYYPTSTLPHLRGVPAKLLRVVAKVRYEREMYTFPIELSALHKLVRYRRPETSGF
jgi:anaerobic magnesium-protoporphyrin IX monomethyl ester cyclase